MYPNSGKPAIGTRLALTLLLASVASPIFAGQLLEGRPDDALTATVSRNEPNLIRVDGGKIRRIHGVEGEFVVSADRETGAAYLKPTTEQPQFSVFVADDAGRHWKLLLQTADIPAETLVIRDRSQARSEGKAILADDSRLGAIRRVLLALARDAEPEDMTARNTLEIVPLWNEARLILVRTLDGALFGEKYQLINVSSSRMVIDERELYRPGVLAVMVDSLELEPGESTDVLVVLEGRDG
jgi:conjugal transfer pilus assembly protein TraK